MAHFAEIDEKNIVLRVVLIEDAHEGNGSEWCADFFGGGTWVQTSYNCSIRKNFAGVGYKFDSDLDAFIPPQPFSSWSLDDNAQWQPPTPYPDDGEFYTWNEENQKWDNE